MKTQYETALSGAKEESVQIIADARSDAKALSERTLKEANEELHTTILMVTHDAYAASFASFKVFNNSVAEFESNAPVGSSANKILGCFTMALAADARCLCPPDSSFGYLSN